MSLTERGVIREYLAFVLAGELYGVALTRVREIVSPPPITPVPRAGRDVIGVCSVRGLLVTVVDLGQRLRLKRGESNYFPEETNAPRLLSRKSRILLVVTNTGEVVGLMVDEVKQVVRFAESEIESAQSFLGGDVSEQVEGVGRLGELFIVLLDLGSVVSGAPRE